MSNNKIIGNKAENAFAALMFSQGWWVHIFATKVVGQPFDCICAYQGAVWFVDVKNVEGLDYLLHSRIEANQQNAMKMLAYRGFKTVGFVCLFDDGWYLLQYHKIDWTAKMTHKDKMEKVSSDVNETFLI